MAILPSELVKDLLSAHIAVSGWQIEIARMPDSPDRVIGIYDRPGAPPNPKFLLDFPSVAILVRGATSDLRAVRDEAQAVFDILLGVGGQDVLGERVVSITAPGNPTPAHDRNERPVFSVNISMITEPAASPETNRVAL